MPDPGAIAVSVGIAVFNRISPTGLAWIKAKIVGRDILIVGPQRAGKSSLSNYLEYGIFADPDSPRTRHNRVSASFTLSMGRQASLRLQVRKTVDTVGQVSPSEHAIVAGLHKPRVLIVMLDATSPWGGSGSASTKTYLDEFVEYFVKKYRVDWILRKKLQAIFVVLNKVDKIKEQQANSLTTKIGSYMKVNLLPHVNIDTKRLIVMECCLVEEYDSGRSVNAIIQKMALTLEGR